jgi:hypothetical protein
MTQALYAHMNNKKIKIFKKKLCQETLGIWVQLLSIILMSQGPSESFCNAV